MAGAGICATSPDLRASRAAASSNPRASAERHYIDARRRSGVPGRNSGAHPAVSADVDVHGAHEIHVFNGSLQHLGRERRSQHSPVEHRRRAHPRARQRHDAQRLADGSLSHRLAVGIPVHQVTWVHMNPGAVTHWHARSKQTDRIVGVSGNIKLALWDGRDVSPTKAATQIVRIGAARPVMIIVPPHDPLRHDLRRGRPWCEVAGSGLALAAWRAPATMACRFPPTWCWRSTLGCLPRPRGFHVPFSVQPRIRSILVARSLACGMACRSGRRSRQASSSPSATPCAARSDCWPPPSDEAQKPTARRRPNPNRIFRIAGAQP
jgi:hypothetical protein